MRLSEAIREGAKLRPQVTDGYFKRCKSGEIGSCAWGAAYEAEFEQIPDVVSRVSSNNLRAWPFVGKPEQCPACGYQDREQIATLIVHLNDDHLWSREQIADWVETVEPKEAA